MRIRTLTKRTYTVRDLIWEINTHTTKVNYTNQLQTMKMYRREGKKRVVVDCRSKL